MPFSLAGLFQGLGQGVEGALQGQQNRKLLEQQALHQQLADELLKAQTEYFRRRPGAAGGKFQHLQDQVTGQVFNYNPETGELSPATMETPGTPAAGVSPQQPATPSQRVPAKLHVKPSSPIVAQTPQGGTVLVSRDIQVPKGGLLDLSGSGVGKALSPTERKAAGTAVAAKAADQDLRQIEDAKDARQIADEVARFVAIPAIGRLIPGSPGFSIQELLQSARSAGLSERAQYYLKRLYDYSSIAGPGRYGRSAFRSTVFLQQLWTDFGIGQFGITPAAIKATQRNRAQANRQFETEAGPRAMEQAGSMPADSTAIPPAPVSPINPRFDPRKQP